MRMGSVISVSGSLMIMMMLYYSTCSVWALMVIQLQKFLLSRYNGYIPTNGGSSSEQSLRCHAQDISFPVLKLVLCMKPLCIAYQPQSDID